MSVARIVGLGLFYVSLAFPATFGTATAVVGGVADIILDEGRNRLYLVNTVRNQVEVYSIPQRRFLNPVPVEQQPLAGAMSRSGKFLYVTAHAAGALMTIDLDTLQVVNRVSLPARPEGVAVGADERVLISTVGTGPGNSQNVLLIYNPNAESLERSLTAVPLMPPAPASPLSPPNNAGRPLLSNRSHLRATEDGSLIIGVNIPNNNTQTVFVYEAASGTVLRSRALSGVSPVVSIAPDNSKFMAGLNLIDTETLAVIARQNAANAPYPFPAGTNFNLQQNQGGSVFAPDGSLLFSAFNFNPVTNPPGPANVSQLMINDPDNLLIQTALQLPENLAGKMVITSNGATIFAISESGFLTLPIGSVRNSPLADVQSRVVLLANDQCGVTSEQRTGRVIVANAGSGRLTASAALLQTPPTGPGGLGGAAGAGGGVIGGGVIIITPPGITLPGLPSIPGQPPPTLPGGQTTPTNNAVVNTAPSVRTAAAGNGVAFEFTYNPRGSGSLGTVLPTHTFLVQSANAVNIPTAIRVFQNNRNAEAGAELIPVEVGLSANEGLVDLVQDAPRQRLYIANSAMNRVEVFDTNARKFLNPIKVGQLPRSLAMSVDGLLLYVANTGGESISIVDLEKMEVVGRVKFPPLPFNSGAALVTPQAIAVGTRGPLVIMSNGTLWRVIGDQAVPRQFSTSVLPANNQGAQILPAPRTMAATPNGEFILVLAGNGFAYLYDSNADDIVQGRQVVSAPIRGYYGPVAAGPRGQYYLVNGLVLNQSLTRITQVPQVPAGATRPGQQPVLVDTPVAAVSPVGTTTFARFSQPYRANANAAVTTPPVVELVNVSTGRTVGFGPALEGPISTPTGTQRANINGRTMAIDSRNNVAYVLTASGLSIVELQQTANAAAPSVNRGGVVNMASYRTEIAQGGLITIFGQNLGEEEKASSTPLPTILGGTCVTLNNNPIPLMMTSPTQINAQIPYNLAATRYQLVVRSIRNKAGSAAQQITVAKYAPAVFVDPDTQQAAIFHQDGRPVTADQPARRDQRLTIYAAGLGPPKGVQIAPGDVTPEAPPALTDAVKVFFGDPNYSGAEMDVEWSGLVPGLVGIYQINVYVPWNRIRGEALPVRIRVGNVTSPATGPVVPVVAVD